MTMTVSQAFEDSESMAELFRLFRSREQLGRAKYGTTVDRTDLPHKQWLEHALFESMDHCLYLIAAIRTEENR